jgi:hypothetical protein
MLTEAQVLLIAIFLQPSFGIFVTTHNYGCYMTIELQAFIQDDSLRGRPE